MLVSHLAERHEFHNLLVGFITLVHPLHFLHFLHFCNPYVHGEHIHERIQ